MLTVTKIQKIKKSKKKDPKFWKFWKILGIFRKCDGFSPANRRRKCADFAKKIPKIFQKFQKFG